MSYFCCPRNGQVCCDAGTVSWVCRLFISSGSRATGPDSFLSFVCPEGEMFFPLVYCLRSINYGNAEGAFAVAGFQRYLLSEQQQGAVNAFDGKGIW